MEKLKLQIIIGSTRQGRVGHKVGQWVAAQAALNSAFEVELIDLAEYNLPLYDEAMLPAMMGGAYAKPGVQRWADKISQADAFMIVTPEYNHGYPAAIKNALDIIYPEWADKAIGFVGYSGVHGAGIRSVEQLIPVVTQLQMIPVLPSVQIPDLMKQMGAEKLDLSAHDQSMSKTLDRLNGIGSAIASIRQPQKVVV